MTIIIYSISIFEPTIPHIWWTKEEISRNCIAWATCQTNNFFLFVDHIDNFENSYNSFFKVYKIPSTCDTICPKNKSSFLINNNFVGALLGFKMAVSLW